VSNSLPTSTRVVIIGGGIIGCSLAYHLTKLGWRDVVVLEQNLLAGGTTWHAAGLVGRLRTSTSLTAINKYSVELYQNLERETGHSVGWKEVGSLILGRSEARMTQLKRTLAMAEWFNVESRLISPEEAKAKWPPLRVDDILGAAWLPHDGKVIPKETALALAKGAQSRGATIVEGLRVLDIEHRDGRATGVKTDQGTITAELVVLTGGMWARELGLRCGVNLPLYPVEHHYAVSNPIPGAFDELPVGRDPDLCLYFRGEGDAVMLGAFQAESKPWMVDRVPDKFSFQLLEPDWEKFAEPLRHGKHRIPALETSGFQKFVNGPESFTPDNNFLMGETPELKGLFVACGFNSVGIASAGGAGKYLAEWIIDGQPSLDLWSVDVRRFGKWANDREFLRKRVVEVLGLHYQMAWPNRESETGRDVRLSPLHARLAAAGACFGQKAGWERPNWFTRSEAGYAHEPKMDYSFGRQNWFPNHAAEHRAARETVALFDQTAFAKLELTGPGALPMLQRLCANQMDVAPGRVVYTAMLNERGTFESDLTVVRLAPEKFLLVTGSTQQVRDGDWLTTHRLPGEAVSLSVVTETYAVIGVMGPHSRELLTRLATNTTTGQPADLGNGAFPFGSAQPLRIAGHDLLAVRLTYVGELGWELYITAPAAPAVYDALWQAGADLGVTNAGHYAINSLRLEKGYRAFGTELSPDESPLEAGLGFVVAWDKPGGFLGREALLRQRAAGVKKRLGLFTLDNPEPVLWGSEPILRDGVMVGYTTSGSYGHTVGRGVGMGYVRHREPITNEFLLVGRYEILVNGVREPATLHLKCPVDPERRKILA
jgi:glycine cleavage system aminomethyltransferase T/glycine/D-amino acid oxidase-like deaminating enzyme